MKYVYPKVTKKPDKKPNLTVYMRVYYNRDKKFIDIKPYELLPNDSLETDYPSLKPNGQSISLYVRSVFNDTGTVHDSSPCNLDCNTSFSLNYDRSINDTNSEKRKGIPHKVVLI